jgi:hypothetical protein
MSLRDLACYTLTLKPSTVDPTVIELTSTESGREEHRFARVREQKEGEAYSSSIYGESPHNLLGSLWGGEESTESVMVLILQMLSAEPSSPLLAISVRARKIGGYNYITRMRL